MSKTAKNVNKFEASPQRLAKKRSRQEAAWLSLTSGECAVFGRGGGAPSPGEELCSWVPPTPKQCSLAEVLGLLKLMRREKLRSNYLYLRDRGGGGTTSPFALHNVALECSRVSGASQNVTYFLPPPQKKNPCPSLTLAKLQRLPAFPPASLAAWESRSKSRHHACHGSLGHARNRRQNGLQLPQALQALPGLKAGTSFDRSITVGYGLRMRTMRGRVVLKQNQPV